MAHPGRVNARISGTWCPWFCKLWFLGTSEDQAQIPSETSRIRFRGARFQTPSSVSFLGLIEFRGANSVSSLSICLWKCELTEFLAETHRVCGSAAELSEFSLPKQYSRNSIPTHSPFLLLKSVVLDWLMVSYCLFLWSFTCQTLAVNARNRANTNKI